MSEQFGRFCISYSMSVNKQENRKGSLLQRDVNRRIKEDEKHLLNVTAYIHTNPVQHLITTCYKDYRYSSFRILLSDGITYLKRNEAMEWFGNRKLFLEYYQLLSEFILREYFVIED